MMMAAESVYSTPICDNYYRGTSSLTLTRQTVINIVPVDDGSRICLQYSNLIIVTEEHLV